MTKRRVESFSDGVFAVAITILVFNVHAPDAGPGGLAHALLAQWPTYVAYVASFLTIGVMWINHHGLFERIARIDRSLFMLNLLLLMTIVFLPFPTALMGQYIPAGGSNANAAATYYALVASAIATCFSLLWVYSLTHPRLLVPGIDPAVAMKMLPRFSIGFFVYLACIAIAQVSAIAVVIVCSATAVYYLVERLPDVVPSP